MPDTVPIPQGATVGGAPTPGQVPIPQGATLDQPQQPDSGWRKAYDYSGLGALQKLTGNLSQWAQGKANQAQTATQRNVAQGGQPSNEYVSSRAGYDLLSHTAGLVSGFLEPKNVAITGGVIAANTNPFTGIPVDAALVAHGGYGVYKNAPAALQGDPDAVQNTLLSASEMAGGAAGTAGQVRAFRGPARAPAPTSEAATPEQAAATGATPSGQAPSTALQARGAAPQPAAQAPAGAGESLKLSA